MWDSPYLTGIPTKNLSLRPKPACSEKDKGTPETAVRFASGIPSRKLTRPLFPDHPEELEVILDAAYKSQAESSSSSEIR